MTPSEMNTDESLHKRLKSRWLIRLVNVLLVLWLVWLVSDAVWQYFQPVPEAEDKTTVTPPPATTRPKITAKQMTDWHLFGIADEQEKTNIKLILNAPETSLKLSLKGIVATDDRFDGYAIIQKPDKEELHFRVRDSVFGLATLEEIYIDRVILLRGGHYETLKLPIEFMNSDPFLERQRKEEAKRIASDFRHKMLNRKGMELMNMFGFDTAYRNGSFVGFTVKVFGKDGSRMLEALGVEEGDLITVVNGKRFSESIEAVQSLSKLKDATEVDIEIDRKGVPMFFHFDFSDLEQTADLVDDGTPGATGDSAEVVTDQPASNPADNPDP